MKCAHRLFEAPKQDHRETSRTTNLRSSDGEVTNEVRSLRFGYSGNCHCLPTMRCEPTPRWSRASQNPWQHSRNLRFRKVLRSLVIARGRQGKQLYPNLLGYSVWWHACWSHYL